MDLLLSSLRDSTQALSKLILSLNNCLLLARIRKVRHGAQYW